ncbi:MAG TPA: proton-conducting transporter membrane subunit [Bacteroidales bacterium]|nr:proton-conducting transporter membrane subunit [Bacteroidales bacterium]
MNELLYIIWIPLLAGLVLFLVPESLRKMSGLAASVISAAALLFAIVLYLDTDHFTRGEISLVSGLSGYFEDYNNFLSVFGGLLIDNIARLVVLLITFFTFLITIYSLSYTNAKHRIKGYYSYVLLTSAFSSLAVLSDHLIFFIFCWGILGILLYKLIKGDDDESAAAAKKTMILIGASDTIMLVGIGIVYKINASFSLSSGLIPTNTALGATALVALLIGSFTKAGAFPFHTWVPDFAKKAPASSTALLPASLDKLLGIYFMFRICTSLFTLTEFITLVLVIIGVVTIISGVMMALVQHNTKQLLGYHAVSQVGYMVLGLALGSPIGIAGGLFHMLNHTMYKAGLFLVAGNVEDRFGTDNIEHLGGSAKFMPLTFLAAVIFSLSISGVPPLNGFASKWLIYQGIIDFGSGAGIANRLWTLWLGLAVLGSALTLASFMKFLAGVFLGRTKNIVSGHYKTKTLMMIPISILAIGCILIGIFATGFVIPSVIKPLYSGFDLNGIWQSSQVAALVGVSILMGVGVYLAGSIKKFRVEDSFIGGEKDQDVRKASVLDFYKTISTNRIFSGFYYGASRKWFDLYDIGRNVIFSCSKIASSLHTGILPFYVTWLISGLIILLIIMLI